MAVEAGGSASVVEASAGAVGWAKAEGVGTSRAVVAVAAVSKQAAARSRAGVTVARPVWAELLNARVLPVRQFRYH